VTPGARRSGPPRDDGAESSTPDEVGAPSAPEGSSTTRKRRKATAKTTQSTASTAATAASARTSSAAKAGAAQRDAPVKDASASKRGASAKRTTGATRAAPTTPGGTTKRGSTTKRAGATKRAGTTMGGRAATRGGATKQSSAATSPTSPDPGPTPETAHDKHPSTTGYGSPAPDACSVQWDQDGTSAYGTAARARFFVVVEQPGPWGRDAARESHLDRELGLELDARTAGAGGRFMLMRRPGGHPVHDGPRRVLLAHAGARPGEAWALAADLHVGDLLGLDWASLARGSEALVRASLPGAEPAPPTLLVCTNGRRDVCCAVRGRPVAVHGGRVAPGRVWEVSHTGGHRFAPTAVLLPWGQTLARLEDRHVEWVTGASDTAHVPVELLGPLHDRGRSPLDPAAQSAESHVRAALGETHLPALWAEASTQSDAGSSVRVTHADGRVWTAHVERVPSGRTRPESCGKQAVEVAEHLVRIVSGPPLG
jgi:hypothetical protein